jgi:hypothetical protein
VSRPRLRGETRSICSGRSRVSTSTHDPTAADEFRKVALDGRLVSGATTHERLDRVSDHLVRIRACHSTHAICYHRRVFDFILERIDRDSAIDLWLRSAVQPAFTCYGTNPLIATQRPSYSDILRSTVDYAFIEANYRMNTAHLRTGRT